MSSSYVVIIVALLLLAVIDIMFLYLIARLFKQTGRDYSYLNEKIDRNNSVYIQEDKDIDKDIDNK